MASITLIVPDAVVPRIQEALGTPGVPATAAEVKSWLIGQLKVAVTRYETKRDCDALTAIYRSDVTTVEVDKQAEVNAWDIT